MIESKEDNKIAMPLGNSYSLRQITKREKKAVELHIRPHLARALAALLWPHLIESSEEHLEDLHGLKVST